MALLLHSERPQLTPSSVLKSARPPGFHPGHEQDSSEFLGHLLDKLHEQQQQLQHHHHHQHHQPMLEQETAMEIDDIHNESPPPSSPPSSPPPPPIQSAASQPSATVIQNSFGGNISITYKCLTCDTKSKQYDSFRDLHLSFPAVYNKAQLSQSSSASINMYSVQELLDFYCSTERLDADNQYYCDRCQALCDGERCIDIVAAPKNLILTLKHFKYDQTYNQRAKLHHKVSHEEQISIKVLTPQPNNNSGVCAAAAAASITLTYKLYAAVVHSGVSMETGHYFTYGSDDSGWYKFDDTYVSKSTIYELHNLQPPQTPYILFYELLSSSSSSSAGGTMMTDNASLTTVSNAIAAVANNKELKLYEYPTLNDLPPLLRDYVNCDNRSYAEEMRRTSTASSTSLWSSNRRNDYYDGRDRRDDDDDQLGGGGSGGGGGVGGGNFLPYYIK